VVKNTVFEAQWDQAREIVHAAPTLQGTEQVELSESIGRVLAQDILALSDMPPFAAARIDGWAVNGPGPWILIGDITAGHDSINRIAPGECAHIATGAAIPAGVTACLKDEESSVNGNVVTAQFGAQDLLVDNCLPVGHDIRPVGYEGKSGEKIISRGARITPAIVGVLATCGYDSVDVYSRITIDVLVFGDELVTQGSSRDGKVRDSLGPQLPAWCDHLGAHLQSVTLIQDTLEAHVSAIRNSTANLIVTTGGTAAGPVDHLHQAIVECGGSLLVDAVLVRPGYHQLFAQIGQQYLLGLPGNPQSAIIGLLSLGSAFISGSQQVALPNLPLFPGGAELNAPAKELRMTLGTVKDQSVHPVEHLDSSMLRGFVDAQGYALVPAGGVKAGQMVRWLKLP
jgi:molybdopterin molybdotransferase